jgi:hypothetical protein
MQHSDLFLQEFVIKVMKPGKAGKIVIVDDG